MQSDSLHLKGIARVRCASWREAAKRARLVTGTLLRAGKVEEIIREAESQRVDADACDKALHYFREGRPFMRYAEYRAKGWFIGSGVIEGACKNVVAERFCRSGMFWSGKGLEAMLPLRAIVKSGRHAAFWRHVLRGRRQIVCAA